ncbi:hypothetical protein [Snodgrassella alvi]|uniref:hypothetical protein n=1 Tax=Snodgrassella alvi TaxID=1196083 RepID=UPI003CC80332
MAKNTDSASKSNSTNNNKVSTDPEITNRSASENRNRREEKRADRYATAQADTVADSVQEQNTFKQEQNTSRRRRQRTSGKNEMPVQQVNIINPVDETQTGDPLIITLTDTGSKNERHKARHDKNSRRQNGKKKRNYIVSARKISRNIDIAAITAQIQLTAEHVLNPEKDIHRISIYSAQPNTLSETHDVIVQNAVAQAKQAITHVLAQLETEQQLSAVDKADIVGTETIIRTQEAITTEPEIMITSTDADNSLCRIAEQGGLILVETSADKAVLTGNDAEPVPVQSKLRRKDIMLSKTDAAVTPAAMEQVETRA